MIDEAGELVMDYVHKVENYSAAITTIGERTEGKIVLRDIMANKNPASQSHNCPNMYTAESRNLIAHKFENDIDMFKYTF